MGLTRMGIKERISLIAGISAFLLILSATAATAGSISGYVFNDLNQNGVMDAGEPGLPGWTIATQGLLTSYTASATTDTNGYYTFPDLAPDLYVVTEALQPGWIQTAPLTGAYGVDLFTDPTLAVTDINFGNYESVPTPPPTPTPTPTPPPSSGVKGKMTGEGSVLASDGTRVKYEFELNCDANKKHSELEVEWGKNKFHLEDLTSASCTDDAAINPEKPSAGFDTYTGEGTGRYNKLSGYTASWIFTDAGKSGKDDKDDVDDTDDAASIKIYDPSGNLILEVSGTGNHKAHNK